MLRARAPLRVSFAGGGTDVSPYFEEHSGAVLSATVSRYAFVTLVPRDDQTVSISSLDYDLTVHFDAGDPVAYNGQLDLAKAVYRLFRREYGLDRGVDMRLHNDAPPGSGLGSSSAMTVALIKAHAELQHVPLDDYEIAELAYRIERDEVGMMGGKQDQYACTFGGINFIEFTADNTVVNQLRIRPEVVAELEYSLLFAYIGGARLSAHIIERQVANYREQKAQTVEALHQLRALAEEAKRALLLNRLGRFAETLDAAWQLKRQLAAGISNERVDEIYEEAKKAGAIGGKLSGAGGGGFMYFFCEPQQRFRVQEALRKAGAEMTSLTFVMEGARAWTVD